MSASDVRLNTERIEAAAKAMYELTGGKWERLLNKENALYRMGVALAAADAAGSWNDTERLRTALAPFAEARTEFGQFVCEGTHDTGYVCGVDRDGRDIYGFTDFCRWCVARRLFDSLALAESVPSPPPDAK